MTKRKNTKLVKVKRDGAGLWQKGSPSPNPGGRPTLPEEFRAKGPKILADLVKIAENTKHKRHYDALVWCAERIFGKPRQEVDVAGGALTPAAAALLVLVQQRRAEIEAKEQQQEEPK